MNNITLNGYHITDSENSEDIIQNGFTYKESPKHYLGQGVYFYSNLETAKLNINNSQISYGITLNKDVIHCCIDVCENQYLDLDNVVQNNKFREFYNQIIKESGIEKIEIGFKSELDFSKNKHLYYKCFMLDLYKEENNYKVVSKTFSNDNPTYGVKVLNLEYLRLPFLEKYLCVTDNDCITHKEIVYSKTIEEVEYI